MITSSGSGTKRVALSCIDTHAHAGPRRNHARPHVRAAVDLRYAVLAHADHAEGSPRRAALRPVKHPTPCRDHRGGERLTLNNIDAGAIHLDADRFPRHLAMPPGSHDRGPAVSMRTSTWSDVSTARMLRPMEPSGSVPHRADSLDLIQLRNGAPEEVTIS